MSSNKKKRERDMDTTRGNTYKETTRKNIIERKPERTKEKKK